PGAAGARTAAGPDTGTRAESFGAPSGYDSGPPSGAAAEARGPYPARRQQPVLFGAARRSAYPASAGSAPRSRQTWGAPSGRVTRQHAGAARWRGWWTPSTTHRCTPTGRRPARWAGWRPHGFRWR